MKKALLFLLSICAFHLSGEPLVLDEDGARGAVEQGEVVKVADRAGVALKGSRQSIRIDGSVITTGDDAFGVHIDASGGMFGAAKQGASLLNRGLIQTAGKDAHAVYNHDCENFHLTNTGSIIATGEGAHAIATTGDGVLIRNAGTIRSADGHAVRMSGRNGRLELYRGSNLQGEVYSFHPFSLSVESGLNLLLTTRGAGYQNLSVGSTYVFVGQTLASIDPTNFVMQADWTADLTDTLFDGLYQHRLGCCTHCQPMFWLQGLGSYRKRSEEGSRTHYDDWLGGGLLGYSFPCYDGSASLYLGITGGGGNVNEKAESADMTSYFGGVAYERPCQENFFGFAFAVGYVDWEHRRDVMNNLAPGGIERADADSDALLFAADATFSHRFSSWYCRPIGSVSLRYAGLFFDDYVERGETFNLTVNDRQVDLLTTRFELALPYGMRNRYYCWSFEPYIGLNGRFQVGGKVIEGSLQGAAFSCDQEDPTNLAALLLGFRGTQTFDSFDLFLNVEWSFDQCESARVLGEGGIRWNF